MSYEINNNEIRLTRGDTLRATIEITDSDGSEYTPNYGDSIRFAMKKDYSSTRAIVINIPIETMELHIKPEVTKCLPFGKYVYDIELTKNNGDVDTFIKGDIVLTEEVE